MKTFKQFIIEAKKPHYWLALDIPKGEDNWRGQTGQGVVDQLKAGKLTGVKGISSHKNIVRQMFHTTRNTVLAMPADETHRLNPNLRHINYSDPNEFTKNGMHDAHRVFQKEKDHRGLDQLMGHIMANANKHFAETGQRKFGGEAFNRGQEIADVWKKHGIYPSINSPDDFDHHVRHAFKLNDQDHQDWIDGKAKEKAPMNRSWHHQEFRDWYNHHGSHAILQAFGHQMHKMYGDEKEISVDADHLHIPKSTRIISLSDREEQKKRDTADKRFEMSWDKEQTAKHHSHETRLKELGQHYKTSVVDDRKYSENKPPSFGRRAQKRPKE